MWGQIDVAINAMAINVFDVILLENAARHCGLFPLDIHYICIVSVLQQTICVLTFEKIRVSNRRNA